MTDQSSLVSARAAGVLTLLDLSEALAKNSALQSVCSDGNSDVREVARDLAITVMEHIAALKAREAERG